MKQQDERFSIQPLHHFLFIGLYSLIIAKDTAGHIDMIPVSRAGLSYLYCQSSFLEQASYSLVVRCIQFLTSVVHPLDALPHAEELMSSVCMGGNMISLMDVCACVSLGEYFLSILEASDTDWISSQERRAAIRLSCPRCV